MGIARTRNYMYVVKPRFYLPVRPYSLIEVGCVWHVDLDLHHLAMERFLSRAKGIKLRDPSSSGKAIIPIRLILLLSSLLEGPVHCDEARYTTV